MILEELERLGNINWKGENKDNFSINWYSSFELADEIYKWVKIILNSIYNIKKVQKIHYQG